MEDTIEIEVPEELELDDVLSKPESVTVIVNKQERKYWIRPPNRPEKTMAANAARRVAKELRDLLENPNSEEHDLLVRAALENMEADEKRLLWLTAELYQKTFELNRRSLENREDYFVPEPEGKEEGVIPPTLEDWDRYETEKQKAEKQRLVDLAAEQKNVFAQLKSKAETIDENDLDNLVESLVIENAVNEEWSSQYGLQVLVRCTFSDPELTQRVYKTPEAAKRLLHTKNGERVLQSLLAAHNGLMLDPDQLKN